jgi:membrane protein YqaA with SNARE-associated domain
VIYFTLFFASLLAATLLPGGSEALLLYDLSQNANIFLLVFVATLGNTMGSVINYVIGRKGIVYLIHKGYAKEKYLQKAHIIFDRYGAAALLFSWMPVLGDPITFIAGVTEYDFKKFLFLVLIAKGIRYVVITGLYLQLI